MYKIFIKNLEGFEKAFKDDERLILANPLYLLKDIRSFNRHKNENTNLYQNLYLIMKMALELKKDQKYYSFGMLFTELELQYFEFTEPYVFNTEINPVVLDYQVSLLHQFMFPAYYQ